MTIRREKGNIVITIPDTFSDDSVQRLLDYLKYQELSQKSTALQDDVEKLSKQVNSSWWMQNKARFLVK